MWRLVIRNPATGAVEIDSTTDLQRLIGSVTTVAGQAGAITVPEFATGTPWAAVVENGLFMGQGEGMPPEPTISGTTLSWTASDRSARILFGSY